MRTYLFFLVLLYRATVLAGSGPCDNATTLICGQLYPGNTLGGTSQFDKSQYTNCINDSDSEAYDGNDMVFKLSFTERKVIHIYLHMPTNKDLDMFLFQECDDLGHCLASSFESNRFDNIFTESIEYIVEQGSYFLIVDGKQSNDNGMFTVQVLCECSCIEDLNPLYARSIRCENFDVYDNKPVDHQSNRWSKRFVSGTPAQVRDGYVETLGSEKVLRVKAGPFAGDIYYDLSDLKKDKHRVSWKMFFETGATGVYQLINGEQADGTYADGVYDVYFKAQNRGAVVMNNDTVATFNYNGGNWNDVMQIVDPKNDSVEIWINHQFVFGTKYSAGASFPYRIKALRFYTITNSNYLIDHICAWEKVAHGIVTCVGDSVCTASGATYKDSCAAEQDFYTSLEYQACNEISAQNIFSICDYGGTAIYRSDDFTGTFSPYDEFPGLLMTDSCIVSIYGQNIDSIFKVQIKAFYNDVTVNVDPIFNSSDDGTHMFIFQCEYDSITGKQYQINLGEEGEGGCGNPVDLNEIGIYYMVMIGVLGSTYSLQIVPEGDCNAGDFDTISCGQNYVKTLSSDSDFDKNGKGDYERCYNGTHPYLGNDRVFSFNIHEPTYVTITLDAADQKAIFLYDVLCGQNCLTYAEIPPGDTSAVISHYSLLTGRYYIIVDSEPGAKDTFGISLECEPDLGFIPRIFESDDPDCPVENETLDIHTLAIPKSASTDLHNGTYLLIGYSDTQNKEIVDQSFWPDGGLSLDFALPRDSMGDAEKCGYELNDLITVSLFTSYNEENYHYYTYKPVYAPLSGTTVTAKGNFTPNARSLIEKLNAENQVVIETNPSFRNFNSSSQTADFAVSSNINYTVTQDTSVHWLTLDFVPHVTTVTITLTENTEQVFRETDLFVTIFTDPPIVRKIHITQDAPCISPQVVLTSQASDNTFCEGETVYLTADLTKGIEDFYSFEWNTGQSSSQIAFPAQQTGNFNVIVTEKKCFESDTASINITVIDAPDVEAGKDVTICPGETVELNAISTLPGQYSWSTGQNTSQIFVHPEKEKTYRVTVTIEGEECGAIDSVTVFIHPVAEWSIHPDSLIRCKGDANGQLSITSNGLSQPQSVIWSNTSTASVISGLPTSQYSVLVIDTFGCVHPDTFLLSEPAEQIAFSDPIIIKPTSGNGGEIHVIVSGGMAPYKFTWLDSLNQFVSNDSVLTGQPPGCYTLIVEDDLHCFAQLGCIKIPTSTLWLGDHLLQVYPNPSDGKIFVKCREPIANRVNWNVCDVLGRTIQKGWWAASQEINEVIDLEDNGPGYYLLSFESGKYSAMELIILY